jgi:hypothetical protein
MQVLAVLGPWLAGLLLLVISTAAIEHPRPIRLAFVRGRRRTHLEN